MTGLLPGLGGLVAGVLLGLVHFGSLWWNTRLYAGGGGMRAVAVQVARFALLVAVLGGLAWAGALPLLAGALGLMVARHLVLRRVRQGV